MNSLFIKIGVGTIALTALFLTLTCGTGPETGNQSRSQNPSQNADLNTMIAELRARCQDPAANANTKAEVVNSSIRAHLALPNYEPLKNLVSDGTLSYDFFPSGANNQIEIVISGKFRGTLVAGNSPVEETTMEAFLDILDNFTKKGCINKVRFLRVAPTPGPSPAALTNDGFEWVGCDAGTVYCSNGQCAPPPCARLVNSNTSTPANTGPNSN